MDIGIILAAGKGSRLKCKEQNKTSLKLQGKPLVVYGVELFQRTVDHTFVVVGAFSQSVKAVINDPQVIYVHQRKRLGTGHALQVVMRNLLKSDIHPTTVFLGYGDHMMSYTPETIEQMRTTHVANNAAVTLITATVQEPNKEAFGRIVRKANGDVDFIIEQKDASDEQRKIKEINAGFYCFDFEFLKKNWRKLKKSSVTQEYYLTDFIHIANEQGRKVVAHEIPFDLVGTGINTKEQLEAYNQTSTAAPSRVVHKV